MGPLYYNESSQISIFDRVSVDARQKGIKMYAFSKTRQYALGLIQDNHYLRTGIRIGIDWDGTVLNVS